MTQRTCTIDGCERPHLARGYCRPHYRKHANPDKPRDRRLTITCADCGETVQKLIHTNSDRTRCVPCAYANRGKTIGAKLRGRRTVFPTCTLHTGTCTRCGESWAGSRPRKYCDKACAYEASAERNGWRDRMCLRCNSHLGRLSLDLYCSECRRVRLSQTRRTSKAKRRAQRKMAPSETVRPDVVFDRDRWMCGICGTPVDQALTYPDPNSASLDHIVPLARGGHHTHANTQCAHLICNIRKSDALPVGA